MAGSAEQVIVVSASSKTSIGLGYALQDIADSPHSVGLTSTRNADFVGALGLIDQVCSYDALDAIDTSRPTVIVDMAGNSDLMGRLHEMLGDNMRFTVNVGLTHWDQAAEDGRIIAERSEMFFAPGHMQQRAADWGPEEFSRRSNEFVLSGIERSQTWLKLAVHSGLAGLKGIYPDVCGGHNSPDQGQIIDMTSA